MVRSQGAGDVLGTPLDIALGPLHHFLLELEEFRHFVLRGRQMCGTPSVSGLLLTVRTGTYRSVGLIFLRASPAQALSSLGWPHSRFADLVAAMGLAVTVPVAFGVPPALALLAAFAMSATLATHPAMCPALAAHHNQFLLPIHAIPGPQTSLVMVFAPFMLGVFLDGGIIGVSLWRGPGPFALFPIKQGRLPLGHCLIEALLVVAVQVPN